MAEKQITDMPTRAAPNSRTTKDSERFALISVKATFDGTSAAGDFLPTVQIISDSGREVGTFPTTTTLTTGDTANVTFAPFLRGAQRQASGSTGQAVYFGNPVTLNSNSSALLTWDALQAGDDLLDLTVPAQPTTREAGIYAVSVYVRGQMGAAGEGFFISLEMDTAGDDPQMSQDSDQSPNIVLAFVTTTLVYYSPAGGVVKLLADLGTTAAPRDITLWYGNVAKLS